MFAGLSTYPFEPGRSGLTKVNSEGLRLSKAELQARLDKRSRARYGGGFEKSWLNDLIKDGLVPALIRTGNDGLRPKYEATASHYRRALQLKRLHYFGIRRRDAQVVQLFLRGYGIKPCEIREALRREVIKSIEAVRAQLRSGYFQNTRTVGPKHSASMVEQLGPLDERFTQAALKQPFPYYVEILRSGFGLKTEEHISLFENWFLVGDMTEEFPAPLGPALQFDDATIQKVSTAFPLMDRFIFRPLVGRGVIESPEFTAIALTSMLIAEKMGFTNDRLLAALPNADGFRTVLNSALQALGLHEQFSISKNPFT